jgi:adenylate kinase
MALQTVLFFGRSGSGKGTQASKLQGVLQEKNPENPVLYIETGKLLREFVESDNESSRRTKYLLDNGHLLPEFVPIWIWSQIFVTHYTGNEHLILDGLARRYHEAPILDGALRFFDRKARSVVLINVSRKWSFDRLKERGRYDDTDIDINRRLDWYEEHVEPAIEYLRNREGYTVFSIDGEQPIEKVHENVLTALKV